MVIRANLRWCSDLTGGGDQIKLKASKYAACKHAIMQASSQALRRHSGRQAGKQAGKQAKRQAGKQALGRHSVGDPDVIMMSSSCHPHVTGIGDWDWGLGLGDRDRG